jgi:glycogen(starch) synthase
MRECGVRVVCGKWLVDGSPNVILFDLGSVAHRLNEWKADLWEKAGIPSPATDVEMNDAILLGYSIAWFLGEVSNGPSSLKHLLVSLY